MGMAVTTERSRVLLEKKEGCITWQYLVPPNIRRVLMTLGRFQKFKSKEGNRGKPSGFEGMKMPLFNKSLVLSLFGPFVEKPDATIKEKGPCCSPITSTSLA